MRNFFSKSKFLLCFRPVVHIDAMLHSKVSHTSRFPCHPTSEKHHTMKNSEAKSVYFHRVSPKPTISRVIKAVFSETILNRRARHKNRYIQGSYGSKQRYLKYTESKTPESAMSTSCSPSSCPQASSQWKNVSNEKRKEGGMEKQKNLEWYGIYMVLISLVFTVFWGKLFGIILTSIWLYLLCVWESCQKRLPMAWPSCYRQRQSLQHRGHYGRCAPRELSH